MRFILADDQTIFREGVARICETDAELQLIAQYTDVESMKAQVHQVSGAVVLFSSTLTLDVLGLIRWIQQEGGWAVVLACDASFDTIAASDAAEGILLRSASGQQFRSCLRRVASGGRYRQRKVGLTTVPCDQVGAKAARLLTRREMQIVSLVAEGCKNKAIAGHLGINEQVVRNYLRQIYDKMEVSDRLGLALLKLKHSALSQAVDEARNSLWQVA